MFGEVRHGTGETRHEMYIIAAASDGKPQGIRYRDIRLFGLILWRLESKINVLHGQERRLIHGRLRASSTPWLIEIRWKMFVNVCQKMTMTSMMYRI